MIPGNVACNAVKRSGWKLRWPFFRPGEIPNERGHHSIIRGSLQHYQQKTPRFHTTPGKKLRNRTLLNARICANRQPANTRKELRASYDLQKQSPEACHLLSSLSTALFPALLNSASGSVLGRLLFFILAMLLFRNLFITVEFAGVPLEKNACKSLQSNGIGEWFALRTTEQLFCFLYC